MRLKKWRIQNHKVQILNYILRVHSGANLIIKGHIKTKPTLNFQFWYFKKPQNIPPCIGQNEKNEIKSPSFLAWGRYWFFLPCYMDLQNTRFFQSEDSKCDRIWNPWFFYFFGSDPRASISIKTKIFRNPDFKRIGSKILNWIFPNYDNFSSVRFRSFERHSFE